MVGSNRINYPGEVATPTADMFVAKILFNSVVSTPGTNFMTMDISNFYLMTPLKFPEYICIKLSNIPEKIIVKYDLQKKQLMMDLFTLKTTRACMYYPK